MSGGTFRTFTRTEYWTGLVEKGTLHTINKAVCTRRTAHFADCTLPHAAHCTLHTESQKRAMMKGTRVTV